MSHMLRRSCQDSNISMYPMTKSAKTLLLQATAAKALCVAGQDARAPQPSPVPASDSMLSSEPFLHALIGEAAQMKSVTNSGLLKGLEGDACA